MRWACDIEAHLCLCHFDSALSHLTRPPVTKPARCVAKRRGGAWCSRPGAWRVDQLALMKQRLAAAGAAVLASAAVFVWRRLRHGRSVAPMSAEQLTEMVLRRLNKQATDAVSSARAESKRWRTKYERAQREAEESREKAAELSKLLTKLCASQPSGKLAERASSPDAARRARAQGDAQRGGQALPGRQYARPFRPC